MSQRRSGPLTVLHVVPGLHVGGINRSLIATVAALRDAGCDQVVCALNGNLLLGPDIEALGVDVVSLGHSGMQSAPRTVWRLARLARSRKVSVIHAHLDIAVTYGALAARLAGCRCVATVHSVRVGRSSESRWGALPFGQVIYRLGVDRVIAVSTSVRDAFASARSYDRSRIEVIHNGIDAALFDAPDPSEVDRVRRDLQLDPATPILVNVGRLVPEKNQRILVPVVAALTDRHPAVVLVIAGEGPLRADLERSIEAADLTERVRLIGSTPAVVALLHLADVVVISSAIEGFTMVALEAMAAGRPIVASRIGPIAEAIRDGVDGLLADPSAPPEFVDAIETLLDDPQRARSCAVSARQRVVEEFGIDRSAQRLAALYADVVGTA